MINLINRAVLATFVSDNIADYNQKSGDFSAKKLSNEIFNQLGLVEEAPYTDSEIGVYLSDKFRSLLDDVALKSALDVQLDALSGTKKAIDSGLLNIANTEVIYIKDLTSYYRARILKNLQITYESNNRFRKSVFDRILAYSAYTTMPVTQYQIKYVENDLKHATDKALYLAFANGFTNKRIDINTGTKLANEGDSAQFLFLARAVLAGYTCSNVDVRSSRYDAVIDYEGHLLRVQVKGISGSSILLKDRDRGGAGTDPTASRNRGRYISSDDADIYVAVDKQFGICYLIPTTDIDVWVAAGNDSKPVKDIADYKENWEVISEVAAVLFP